jgi:predicted dehydrogenase
MRLNRSFQPARRVPTQDGNLRMIAPYSGGIATDLFYHALAPMVMITGQMFPARVTASGGIFVQKDREVPDTFLMNADYASFSVQLSCSVVSGAAPVVAVNGTEGRLLIARNGEDFSHTMIEITPDREYRKEFKAKTGDEKLMIECKPNARGSHPHMENFLDCVRSRQRPNLDAELGYRVMAAIRMGVDAYRQQTTMQWDARRERAVTTRG